MGSIDLEDDEGILQGPGWKELQVSIEKLRSNFTTLCDSLEIIVNLENTKLLATGRVEIPDTSRRILSKELQFIEKFKTKIKHVERIELDAGDVRPEYAVLYQSLNKHIQDSVQTLRNDLDKRLTTKTKATQEVINENQTMLVATQNKDRELMTEQKRSETASAEKNTLAARCNKLEQLIEEKNVKIQQLTKESTVVLWKREKQKLIGSIYTREEGLEQKLQSTSEEADDTKFRLQRRIESLQNKLRMEQLRNTTKKSPISFQEATILRRNLFLKERLYVIAESELRKQQIYYLGLLEGLRKDYQLARAASKKLTEGEGGGEKQPTCQRTKEFTTRMNKVIDALKSGTIIKLRSTLPSYYNGRMSDNKDLIPNKVINGKGATDFIVKISPEEEKNLESTDLGRNLVRWRLGNDEKAPTLSKLLRDIQKEHPSFVDDQGRLLVKEVTTFFPNLSQEEAMHYFRIFSMWDDNGDMDLDTTEILHNMPGMLGHMTTTEEVADAIREVDVDESGTIDFYEFLLLVKMLQDDLCKSSLFQKNDFLKVSHQLNDSNSKVCTIQ